MDKFIVTISREFGCGALEITKKLAQILEITYHDKDLIDHTLSALTIDKETISIYDDNLPKEQKVLWNDFGYGSSAHFLTDFALERQKKVIHEFAEKKESSIFLGRCANYYLSEEKNIIRFFLYASYEFKLEHIEVQYNMPKKDAEKMLKRIDKQKHNYYKYVTGKNRGDRSCNDISLCVDSFGIDGTVKVMDEIIKQWRGMR